MGILSGLEIYKEVQNGNIKIDPFCESRINPNSYNLCLDRHLKIYTPKKTAMYHDKFISGINEWDYYYPHNGNIDCGCAYLDMHAKDETEDLYIGDDGIILLPNNLYLGSTIEHTWTNKYVPMIEGRSSVGRKGMTIHVTAGFGDIGFNGKWTLEITVVHPLKVYYNDEVCQISYLTVTGDTSYQYNGRYQGQLDVVESRANEEKKGIFTHE